MSGRLRPHSKGVPSTKPTMSLRQAREPEEDSARLCTPRASSDHPATVMLAHVRDDDKNAKNVTSSTPAQCQNMWVLGLLSFTFSSLLGWIMMPLPLHARADMGDVDGKRTAQWLSVYVGLRLPLGLAVGVLGMRVEVLAALLPALGFLLAAFAPKDDLALLAMCVLASPLCTLRSTVNIRMKLTACSSELLLSQASTFCNRGRLLGRIFRSIVVGILYQFCGFRVVCFAAAVLAGIFVVMAVAYKPTAATEAMGEKGEGTQIGGIKSVCQSCHQTGWVVWALASSFALHEFAMNSLAIVYTVAASRDAGLSKVKIGLVQSAGLLIALGAEVLGTTIPSKYMLRSPLHVLFFRCSYVIALHLMAVTSSSAPVFVPSCWLALCSEAMLQKALMEMVVGATDSASTPTVLAIMEGASAVLASAGVAVGATLVAVDSRSALQLLAAFALVHGTLELGCFSAVAHKLFVKVPSAWRQPPLAWIWGLLQFQRCDSFLGAIKLIEPKAH